MVILVRAVFGFNEPPDMQEILKLIALKIELQFELSGMSRWREHIFSWMLKNSARQSDFFKIPLNGLMKFVTKIRV